jgi:CRP-like cAMP-binding protein
MATIFKNALLAHFSDEARAALVLRAVKLEVNQPIYEPNQPIDAVYFVETGVISVVGQLEDGRSIEVGTIGRESMAGTFLVLDTDAVPYRHFVQIDGDGYAASAERFMEVVTTDRRVRRLVSHAEAAFRTQSMQNAVCNGMHNVEQRCCRWILMTRDRVDSDDVKLSHEFLGLMLGVRRASVSDVLAPLQDLGIVKSARGAISILDRAALIRRACECYRVVKDAELTASDGTNLN